MHHYLEVRKKCSVKRLCLLPHVREKTTTFYSNVKTVDVSPSLEWNFSSMFSVKTGLLGGIWCATGVSFFVPRTFYNCVLNLKISDRPSLFTFFSWIERGEAFVWKSFVVHWYFWAKKHDYESAEDKKKLGLIVIKHLSLLEISTDFFFQKIMALGSVINTERKIQWSKFSRFFCFLKIHIFSKNIPLLSGQFQEF